jgi:hypothetical protein
MSFHKRKDTEIEATLFLGGQISRVHKEYKELAMLDPDSAFAKWFIENIEEIIHMEPQEALCKILFKDGQITQLSIMSELTKLSMIVGDTRERISLKGLRDELRQTGSNPQS